METPAPKFWTLFRPCSSASLQALESQSYRYESFEAGTAPVKGDLPVRGNGPSILDLYRQNGKHDRQERFRALLAQNDEMAPPAAARETPMTHGRQESGRVGERGGTESKQSTQSQSGITRSGSTRTLGRRLSIKKMKSLAKGKSSPDLKAASDQGRRDERREWPKVKVSVLSSHFNYNKFEDKPLPKVSNVAQKERKGRTNLPADGKGKGHRRKSTHIDLFDAVPAIKQSQKDEAGRRNYGEDVADRNISMYTPESTRTSIDSRRGSGNHSRGQSDAGIAYSSSRLPPDADWLNQPWVQEGTKPWEERREEHRSSGRSTRSGRSLRQDTTEEDWTMESSSVRNRSKSDVGNGRVVGANRQLQEGDGTDDDSFELGAVTVSDDIFYG